MKTKHYALILPVLLVVAFLGFGMEHVPGSEAALTGAAQYLRLFGLTAGGAYLARGALKAVRDGSATNGKAANVLSARFFAEHLLVAAPGHGQSVVTGADALADVTPEMLSA